MHGSIGGQGLDPRSGALQSRFPPARPGRARVNLRRDAPLDLRFVPGRVHLGRRSLTSVHESGPFDLVHIPSTKMRNCTKKVLEINRTENFACRLGVRETCDHRSHPGSEAPRHRGMTVGLTRRSRWQRIEGVGCAPGYRVVADAPLAGAGTHSDEPKSFGAPRVCQSMTDGPKPASGT